VNPQVSQRPAPSVHGSGDASPASTGAGASSMTKRPRLRSIAAVALGFILTAALSVITDVMLHAVSGPGWALRATSKNSPGFLRAEARSSRLRSGGYANFVT
jgi:hypothetical protein